MVLALAMNGRVTAAASVGPALGRLRLQVWAVPGLARCSVYVWGTGLVRIGAARPGADGQIGEAQSGCGRSREDVQKQRGRARWGGV